MNKLDFEFKMKNENAFCQSNFGGWYINKHKSYREWYFTINNIYIHELRGGDNYRVEGIQLRLPI